MDNLVMLGATIKPGDNVELNLSVAKLHSNTPVEVPVIISRAKKPGPVVLFTAGIHGDEVNGVEIVRQLIAKKINRPQCGTIICMPIINIFGFIHMDREFPDGRDLNRVFPGAKSGSLASRVAHKLATEIIPFVDYVVDFHTGGAKRFNAPQVRVIPNVEEYDTLAKVFGAPFVLYSKNIAKSFRNLCNKMGKPVILFEGGKSSSIDNSVTNYGVNGSKRLLSHLNMLNNDRFIVSKPQSTVFITSSRWVRAKYSGMFKPRVELTSFVEKGDVLGNITDPYGKLNYALKAPVSGYIINVNESPVIYQGDAIFHISTEIKE